MAGDLRRTCEGDDLLESKTSSCFRHDVDK